MAQKLNTELIIKRFKEIHGDKYDYSKFEYTRSIDKSIIICPIHGEFKQCPSNHLHLKQGCPKCANEIKSQKMTNTQNQFIENAIKTHGNKYDYSKVIYLNNKSKITIICPIHGEFKQRPDMHLRNGCPKCAGRNLSLEDFIKQAKIIHGDKYDYSNSVYLQSDKKIKIKCNKCKHIFWQKPWSHLQNHGCPNCCSSKGEEFISNLLQKNNIPFIFQKRFPEWLGQQSLDFYLPEHNIAIEYQGKQHFHMGGWIDNDETLQKTIQRDINKYNLCKQNNIDILYFTNEKNIPEEYIGELLTNEEDLLKRIQKPHL